MREWSWMSRLGFNPDDRLYIVLLLVPAAFVALFYVVPVANVLVLSVSLPRMGLQNYELLLTSGAIQRILTTTARICVITTVITVVAAYLLAYRIVAARSRESRI